MSSIDGIDIELLHRFFEHCSWRHVSAHLLSNDNPSPDTRANDIRTILGFNRSSSLPLAAAIALTTGSSEYSSTLVPKLVEAITTGGAADYAAFMISLLEELTTSAEDLSNWQHPRLFQVARSQSPNAIESFESSVIKCIFQDDTQAPLSTLKGFILDHSQYPPDVAKAR